MIAKEMRRLNESEPKCAIDDMKRWISVMIMQWMELVFRLVPFHWKNTTNITRNIMSTALLINEYALATSAGDNLIDVDVDLFVLFPVAHFRQSRCLRLVCFFFNKYRLCVCVCVCVRSRSISFHSSFELHSTLLWRFLLFNDYFLSLLVWWRLFF